jgi:hypothetical protein
MIDICKKHGIGQAAISTAMKFYSPFRLRGVLNFPEGITDSLILLAYPYYRNRKLSALRFFDYVHQNLSKSGTLTLRQVTAQRDALEKGREEYWELYQDALEARNGYRATAIDLRNRLTKTERLIESLQRSFSEIVRGMLPTDDGEPLLQNLSGAPIP